MAIDPTKPPDLPPNSTLTAPPGAPETAGRPAQIGPYRILETLGQGGMGTVYKAEQRSPVRRMVAMKVIKPGLGSAEVIARFESERQALARMDHPNVAKVLEAGQTESGQPYFVMEYVPGVPITKFADDHKLSIRERLELFKQVCAAIAHAHTKAIIHRDVKASNVLAYLADGKPVVKVIDFGIAKALTGDRLTDRTFNTERGQLIGTYESMSPEQADGSPDIDTRTDVYSLGVLLYELLTGAPPFDRETLAKVADQEIRRLIREVEPPRPSTRLSSLGEAGTRIALVRRVHLDALEKELRSELEWIPLMAMRKDRERRYAGPMELAADIENYLEERPLHAGPESIGYRVRKFLSRNRGGVIAAAAIVVLLVGGIVSTSAGLSWALRERAAANANAEAAKREEGLARLNQMRADENAAQAARNAAEAQRNSIGAQRQLAESLVSQGEALRESGRWSESQKSLLQARPLFQRLNLPTMPADLGLYSLWLESPPALLTLRGHGDAVFSVAIGPDGRTAISGGIDGTARLWDLMSGRMLRTYDLPNNTDLAFGDRRIFNPRKPRVTDVAICPDGRRAILVADGALLLWDLSSGHLVQAFSIPDEINPSTGEKPNPLIGATCFAISRDGLSVVSNGGRELHIWDLASGRQRQILSDAMEGAYGEYPVVNCVAFSPDGRSVLYGCDDGALRLWNLNGEQVARKLSSGTSAVYSVAFGPDGRTAISGSGDNTLRLWDLSSGKEIRTFLGHNAGVYSVAVSPDGRTAVSGGLDKTVRLWDLSTGKQLKVFSGHSRPVSSVAITPDGRMALSGGFDNTLMLWDLGPGRDTRILAGNNSAVSGVAVSPDGRTALSAGLDSTVRLWDLATGQELRAFCQNTSAVTCVAFSPDGRSAFSGDAQGKIKFWDIMSQHELQTFSGHNSEVTSVAFRPDGRTAVSTSADETLRLWDLATGRELRTFKAYGSMVWSGAISPDGMSAVSGSGDGRLGVWDLVGGGLPRILWEHAGREVRAVTVSPDGRDVLTGGLDPLEGNLKLFDIASGQAVQSFNADSLEVLSVALSPDGRTALSAGYDGALKLWDLGSGRQITLSGHKGAVNSAVFSPNGGMAVSGSDDKTVRIWDFGRVDSYTRFMKLVPQAQAELESNPGDAAAMAVLGNWYAFRGIDDWAVNFLERASAGGASISSLTLAQCYCGLGEWLRARREYELAIDSGEAPSDYVNMCLGTLGQPPVTVLANTHPDMASKLDLLLLGIYVKDNIGTDFLEHSPQSIILEGRLSMTGDIPGAGSPQSIANMEGRPIDVNNPGPEVKPEDLKVSPARLNAQRVKKVVAIFEHVLGPQFANQKALTDLLSAEIGDFRTQIKPTNDKVTAKAFALFVLTHRATPSEKLLAESLSTMRELADAITGLELSPIESQNANQYWTESLMPDDADLVDRNGKYNPNWLLDVLNALPAPATQP